MERLQKVIARSGEYSRREAETLMQKGRVIVNGKRITVLGTKVDPQVDSISVNGRLLQKEVGLEYLLFHKPRNCLVTRKDPEGRSTIYDHLPKKWAHLKPVGRLDYDSQGLLLLTNDGALAQRLAHPRYHVNKSYEVKVTPQPGPRQIQRLQNGIFLDDRKTLPARVEILRHNDKSAWISMEIREGRNRQIRRMCEKVGLTVKALKRVCIGPLKLGGLPLGKTKEMTPNQVRQLKDHLDQNKG